MSKKNFWKQLDRPIIALAPMEGYTDSPFRRLCKSFNTDIITITEFTSADGLHYNSYKTKAKFNYHEEEKPIIAQIFGKRIEGFVTAAKYCEDCGFDGIDINMGCPVKKVYKAQHGVALRNNPDLAFKLIEAVAKSTNLPVSIKTRLGINDHDDLQEFCHSAQESGAEMITIHGRTQKQLYRGQANWEPIYKLKDLLNIPVIGNGSISSIEDGYKKLKNLDGFMIGRASMGRPWVFAASSTHPKTFQEKIPYIKKHAQYLFEAKGEQVAKLEFRGHLLSYVKDFPHAKKIRSQLTSIETLGEIYSILDEINWIISNNNEHITYKSMDRGFQCV